MTEHHISPEFIDSAVSHLKAVTEEDNKIATTNTLSLFRQVKIMESRADRDWNPEPLLSELQPETLEKLSEILAPDKIDGAVAKTTDINILGKYIHAFVSDMIREKAD